MRVGKYCLALAVCVLLGVPLATGTAFAQSTFSPGSKPSRAIGPLGESHVDHYTAMRANLKLVHAPECKYAGEVSHVDLSTTSANGTDPHWSVTGPNQKGFGGPTHATHSGWTAVTGYWIQPFTGPSSDPYGTANNNARRGSYTYTIQFTLPCKPKSRRNPSGMDASITGVMAADNSFTAKLNGHQIAACGSMGTTSTCFRAPVTPISYSGPYFHQGVNTLTVTVFNNSGYTGMAAKLTLNLTCGKMCCKELPSKIR